PELRNPGLIRPHLVRGDGAGELDGRVWRDGQARLLCKRRQLAGGDVDGNRADQVQVPAYACAQSRDLVVGIARAGRALDDDVKLPSRILGGLVEQAGGDECLGEVARTAVLRSCSQREEQRAGRKCGEHDAAPAASPECVVALPSSRSPERVRAYAATRIP